MFAIAGFSALSINTATANEHLTTEASIAGVRLKGSNRLECDTPVRQHGKMEGQEMKGQHDMHVKMEQGKGSLNDNKSGMEHPMGMPHSNTMPSNATPDSSPTTDSSPDAATEGSETIK